MNKVKKKLMKFNATDIFTDEPDFANKSFYNMGRMLDSHGELGWKPMTDMFEANDEIIIVLEVAFVKEKDIKYKIEGSLLSIRGIRKELKIEAKNRHFYKMEIDSGPFERIINLPVKIDTTQIKESYENGFFILKLKKIK